MPPPKTRPFVVQQAEDSRSDGSAKERQLVTTGGRKGKNTAANGASSALKELAMASTASGEVVAAQSTGVRPDL